MKTYGFTAVVTRTGRPLMYAFLLVLSCASAACAQTADDEALWRKLDFTEDGWLDGRELDGGWQKYDADGDTEVTKAEFMAGRAREQQTRAVGSPEEDARLFEQLDISKNGSLTGKELDADNVRTYDANGDGRVTREEFLAARAKAREQGAAGAPTMQVSQTGEELLQQGLALRDRGNLGEAAFALRSAIRQNPQSSQAHYQLSLIYLTQHMDALAKASLFRALALNPANTAILNTLAAYTERFAKISVDAAYAARSAQEAEDARREQPIRAPLNGPEVKPAPDEPAAPAPGGDVMTQAEILSFLSARMGTDPFKNPQREQILKELVEMIKARGVDFRGETLAAFRREARKYSTSSEMGFALHANYGPPTKQDWLMGTWTLNKTGALVEYKYKDREGTRTEEGAEKNSGKLTLNPNGTYAWQTSAETFRGAWRKATYKEMQYQGGASVVLLKANGTWDWIVMHERANPSQDDKVIIFELSTRDMKEYGSRGAGKR